MAVPGARLRVRDLEGLRLLPGLRCGSMSPGRRPHPARPERRGCLGPVAGAMTTLSTTISGALALIDREGSELFVDEVADAV